MREIASPLDGIRSPFGARGGADAYAILGYRPELVLDFDDDYYRANSAATTFAGALTFARASSATYVDSTGTLQTASSGVARVGHHIWNGTSWVNEGLLLESETRTNLLTYSEDLSNAAWTKDRVTYSAGALTENTDNNTHQIRQLVSFTSGVTYCLSSEASIASGSRRLNYAFLSAAFGTEQYATFNLDTGTYQVSGSVVAGMIPLGTGKYRCWAALAATASASTSVVIRLADDDLANFQSYLGDGVSGINLDRIQLEAAPTPSSYIPTAGSTVTRAAETLTVPAAKLPYSATAMSFQMDGRVTYADEDGFGTAVLYRWRLDDANRIQINIDTAGALTGRFTLNQVAGGVSDFATPPSETTAGVLVPYNTANRSGSTFAQIALNGASGTVNATPVALPDLSATDLSLGYDYMGTIKTFRVWANDITDAGLEAATV